MRHTCRPLAPLLLVAILSAAPQGLCDASRAGESSLEVTPALTAQYEASLGALADPGLSDAQKKLVWAAIAGKDLVLFGRITAAERCEAGVRVSWESVGELLLASGERNILTGVEVATRSSASPYSPGARVKVIVRIGRDQGQLLPGHLAR